ncbi:DEAD/DEAH box helicase [Solibacillus sp. FSL H8-0538]|uniref:DEAD/DEAH box helicase n=1 Tax=Solibacillus sp. FSL H8-0538 TaxID=2921400 RepID=UPI0030F85033
MRRENSFRAYKGMIIDPTIQSFFTGRIWPRTETPFPSNKIEAYVKRGYFTVIPAIEQLNSKWQQRYKCNRCHNDNPKSFITFHCARCQKSCRYCRHCINMGRMSSCTELIVWNGPAPKAQRSHALYWKGQFTQAQQQASLELTQSIELRRDHLIHAVCGAGKTEILFQAVHKALNEGLRVCVATPRTDVVLELFPRFQQVFPQTTIHALYGAAPKQAGFAQLVLATTHQLYRFEQAFDVMIVDEADAFPYTMDASLQKAVMKAKKTSAPITYVTATPSPQLLSRCRKEHWGYSFIPRRYHGYPLPVPRFQSLWNYDKTLEKGRIPPKLGHWLQEKIDNKQPFLIFFPTIELMEKAVPLFQQIDPSIICVHAEDPDRKEKVVQLRNEQIKGLLTTTILERGITIKNVQVAVIGAESPIFTASALIQISGRVGRNIHYPAGDVVFFHHGITTEMDVVKAEITRLNNADMRGDDHEASRY